MALATGSFSPLMLPGGAGALEEELTRDLSIQI